MKKFLAILVLGLLWCNLGFSKIINIENKISLDVPNSHEFIKIDEQGASKSVLYGMGEILEGLDKLELEFFVIGSRKFIEVTQSLIDGVKPEDIRILRPIAQKAKNKNFRNSQQQLKWFANEIKKLMKKEKVYFYSYLVIANKKLNEIEDEDFVDFINEHQNMSNSELTELAKEYKKHMTTLAGDNKTILINDDMSLIIKKFKIAKYENNQLFLNSNFQMNYINTVKIPMNLFISKKNDHIFLIASECWVNCSKQNSRFEKMIKPTFSDKISVEKTVSSQEISSGIGDQLKQLKQLYDEGALTKEEFEKAKKKLLN